MRVTLFSYTLQKKIPEGTLKNSTRRPAVFRGYRDTHTQPEAFGEREGKRESSLPPSPSSNYHTLALSPLPMPPSTTTARSSAQMEGLMILGMEGKRGGMVPKAKEKKKH